ncbi:hypothetical protein BGZ94_005606 [Podila epigama]|nr:hypothetical protein BGZ94_005606 [Podila epigama]
MAESHTTEEIVSTSDPTVEIIEEVLPDGSISRKKVTSRKITKRVVKQVETDNTIRTSSSSSVSSISHSNSSEISHSNSSDTKTIDHSSSTSSSQSTSSSHEAEVTASKKHAEHSKAESIKEQKTEKNASSESTSKRTFKYKVFGEGDAQAHPFYRFLAKFPLNSYPPQHQRAKPVKPTIYAFAPGWKLNRPAKGADSKDDTTNSTEPESPHSTIGSFDVDSLKWMAYLKFNNIDYDIRPAFEPNMSPNGKLPFLALPDGSFVTSDGFEEFVQENGSPASKLNIQEASEALAFITMAETKIHAALLYTLWLEEAHFKNTTRSHYFGHHVPLLTTVLSYLEKSSMVNTMLLTRTQIDREQIFEEAAVAIDSLATVLGEGSDYFFGRDSPSSLDAIVFAYLHVILTLPKIRNVDDSGRSSELARIVRKYPNLYEYSQKIWRKHFAA